MRLIFMRENCNWIVLVVLGYKVLGRMIIKLEVLIKKSVNYGNLLLFVFVFFLERKVSNRVENVFVNM